MPFRDISSAHSPTKSKKKSERLRFNKTMIVFQVFGWNELSNESAGLAAEKRERPFGNKALAVVSTNQRVYDPVQCTTKERNKTFDS